MSLHEDDAPHAPKEGIDPPFTLITPLETVTHLHLPSLPASRPDPSARPQRRRSVWGMLLFTVGVLGVLVTIMGLLMSTAISTTSSQAAQATAQLPTTVIGAASTTLPATVFPPTPTVPPATPTPAIILPANLNLPPFCTPDNGTPTPGPSPTATSLTAPPCTPCPYHFATTVASHAQVKAALDAAAATYHVPQYLVEAIAQRESAWDPYLISCSFDIGVMQVKYGYWQWVDELNVPSCGLQPTTYSPYDLVQNALLGTKLLAYLTCYYSYAGDAGGTLANPGSGTVAHWYHQANRPYPDTAQTTATPAATGLCAGVFTDPKQIVYKDLPATVQDRWSCPYTARAGDATLLDVVIATYNQGIGTTNAEGIQNAWYVSSTEQYIVQFASS